MNLERLEEQLLRHEGAPAVTYIDSEGILSGGIGHNLIDEPEPGFDKPGIPVPDEVRKRWFLKDIQDAISDLDNNLPWWRDENEVRQNALLNLVFNMGWTGLSTFKNTLRAFEAGDYDRAAFGFQNSQYARQVGPRRSGEIAKMIQKGEWV